MEKNEISFELNEEQLEMMPDSEKLKWMLKIVFINYKEQQKQGLLLYGNGQQGLCEVVRDHAQMFKWMWGAFGVVTGVVMTVLMMHILK
jgi:hypothetical protein